MKKLIAALITASALTTLSGAWAQESTDPIDLNTASTEQLAGLAGIGEKKAQAIVDYRNEHGDFKHIDDLTLVKGIGSNLLERNRDRVTLETP
ncbi:ComEA family DNA-binding protein [Larsenimonas rhizosphaerae]|uniref:Helix-hairpin-helix domain-containing protein n=1 Tax=Larsenimonas rhizosphaerae TaxID=2944682 RepID=A0AA41ZMH7_9GAMM|nr:helix-hairpin-helix domain-containing protein [Larsenimonas rhizosphaerae]MCX2523605.1 helix-hairpin-helix domain-containing protein [Larsenimonas rhizosphaerae]